MPLITKADGTKFGKSESGTAWLDKNKTSSYEMYQFLLNSEDAKVIDYLKKLTFLSLEEINQLEESVKTCPEKREAGKRLAYEVVKFLHGEEEFDKAEKISQALFSGDIKRLNGKEIEMAFKGLTPKTIEEDINIVDLLVEKEICKSKREAREFISNGSITVNGDKVTDNGFNITKSVAIEQKYIVIRRGKKKYYIVTFE